MWIQTNRGGFVDIDAVKEFKISDNRFKSDQFTDIALYADNIELYSVRLGYGTYSDWESGMRSDRHGYEVDKRREAMVRALMAIFDRASLAEDATYKYLLYDDIDRLIRDGLREVESQEEET